MNEDAPFCLNVFLGKYMALACAWEAEIILGYDKTTFEEYHWKCIPDDFENCGGYLP